MRVHWSPACSKKKVLYTTIDVCLVFTFFTAKYYHWPNLPPGRATATTDPRGTTSLAQPACVGRSNPKTNPTHQLAHVQRKSLHTRAPFDSLKMQKKKKNPNRRRAGDEPRRRRRRRRRGSGSGSRRGRDGSKLQGAKVGACGATISPPRLRPLPDSGHFFRCCYLPRFAADSSKFETHCSSLGFALAVGLIRWLHLDLVLCFSFSSSKSVIIFRGSSSPPNCRNSNITNGL